MDYGDVGYQGIEKRAKITDKSIIFRVAIRLGSRRNLLDTPDDRLLDLAETAKAHMRAKVKHPIRVINEQFGFSKN